MRSWKTIPSEPIELDRNLINEFVLENQELFFGWLMRKWLTEGLGKHEKQKSKRTKKSSKGKLES